jgi:ubiquinone/menaquinone biosynthesis C-methylase UbiE
MDKKTIQEYIRALDHMKGFFQNLLENPEDDLILKENKKIIEFTDLRLLSRSDSWPEAVPQEYMCSDDNNEEKFIRADGIIENFEIQAKDLNFLDFGCGEGHVVVKLSETAKKSIGYDIKDQNWSLFNGTFSTKWEEIEKNAPYDIILCNDVLDHTEDILETLNRIQKVKTPQTGKVFVRVHPWTSRHASHLYKQLNKAYLHLVFTDDELFKMGLVQQKIQKILEPIDYYKKAFRESGFTILKEDTINHQIENFFINNEKVKNKIKSHWPEKVLFQKIKKSLEIQFLDFTLI